MTPLKGLKDWVALKHEGQLVRDTNLPYLDHLEYVATTVAQLTPFGYEIGLCHDLLEETDITAIGLKSALLSFGYAANDADYITLRVNELTDVFTKKNYPELSKKERKAKEAKRLMSISATAQTVKYADLIYNIKWMSKYASKKKLIAYLKKKHEQVLEMRNGDMLLRNNLLNAIQQELNESHE